MAWIKLFDRLTVTPKSIDEAQKYLINKDADGESQKGLLLHVPGTHAGIVNGNKKFYRPDRMQQGTPSWFPKNSFAKPVLIGHDEKGPVVGRVREANYVDDSWKYASDFPTVKDTIFYSRNARSRMSLFKSVDWVAENLMSLDDYTGLGYIDLGLQITNRDAIEKVMNDEYLTVSVGSRTDSAMCSICQTDWAIEEPCDHKPGSKVDGKRAFLITGQMKFDEVSFVNFPADPFAVVQEKVLKDQLEKIFFLGLDERKQDKLIEAGLKMTDSIYELDINPVYEDMMNIDLNDVKNIDQFETEMKAAELTAVKAFEMKDALAAWKPESEDLKTRKRSLFSSLNIKIRKNSWDKEAPVANTDAVTTEGDVDEAKNADAVTDALLAEVAEAESANADAKQGNNAMKAQATSLDPAQGATGKATSSKSQAKANDQPDEKKANKKKKCAACAKDFETTDEARENCDNCHMTDSVKHVVDMLQKDEQTKTAMDNGAEVVALIKSLDSEYSQITDGNRYTVRYAVRCLIDHWSADDELKYWLNSLATLKDSVVITNSDLADKEETLNDLMTVKDSLEAQVKTVKTQAAASVKAAKQSLATTLVVSKVLRGEAGFTELSQDQVQSKVEELSSRKLVSLQDSVNDLFAELKFVKSAAAVTTSQDEKADEPEVKVEDNARVSEQEGVQMTDAQRAEKTRQDRATMQRMIAYMNPVEREIFLADIRTGKVAL